MLESLIGNFLIPIEIVDFYNATHTLATGFAGISTGAALPLSLAAPVLSSVLKI